MRMKIVVMPSYFVGDSSRRDFKPFHFTVSMYLVSSLCIGVMRLTINCQSALVFMSYLTVKPSSSWLFPLMIIGSKVFHVSSPTR